MPPSHLGQNGNNGGRVPYPYSQTNSANPSASYPPVNHSPEKNYPPPNHVSYPNPPTNPASHSSFNNPSANNPSTYSSAADYPPKNYPLK